MAKNVILFGGSFDPVHRGHEASALNALEMAQKRSGEEHDLWFLPASSDAFNVKHYVSADHRINMLRIVVDNAIMMDNVQVSTFEIEMANRAGTYAVVNALMRAYPSINFKFLMGTDQANNIRMWRNSRNLLKLIPIMVVKRIGYFHHNPMLYWIRKKPHMYLHEHVTDNDISSSSVRQYLTNPENRSAYKTTNMHDIRGSVKRYIFDHNLYIGESND